MIKGENMKWNANLDEIIDKMNQVAIDAVSVRDALIRLRSSEQKVN